MRRRAWAAAGMDSVGVWARAARRRRTARSQLTTARRATVARCQPRTERRAGAAQRHSMGQREACSPPLLPPPAWQLRRPWREPPPRSPPGSSRSPAACRYRGRPRGGGRPKRASGGALGSGAQRRPSGLQTRETPPRRSRPARPARRGRPGRPARGRPRCQCCRRSHRRHWSHSSRPCRSRAGRGECAASARGPSPRKHAPARSPPAARARHRHRAGTTCRK